MNPEATAAVKAFYAAHWSGFRYSNRLKYIRAGAIIDLLAQARLVEPRILDLGGGTGWLTNILSMFGPTVGVELSGQAVAVASTRFPHATFVEAEIRAWNPPAPFDLVVAQEMLEHFEVHQEWRVLDGTFGPRKRH